MATAVLWQLGLGAFVLLATIVAAAFVPGVLANVDLAVQETMFLLVLLLGSSLAIEMSSDFARGVLTGYHRWDINSGIAALTETLTAIGLIVCLLAGGGLVSLGIVVLVFSIVAALLRVYASSKFFDYRELSLGLANWSEGVKLAVFGFKQSAVNLPIVLTTQSFVIFIGVVAGPAVLAVYSRPLALATHIDVLVRKYTNMLVSVSGSLVGAGDSGQVRDLFLQSSRYTAAIAFPMLAMLAIYGDTIVTVWMGSEYVSPGLTFVLGIGFALPLLGSASVHVLTGANQHGVIAKFSNVLMLVLLPIALFALNDRTLSLVEVAAAMVIVLSTIRGLVPIAIALRRLEVSVAQYAKEALAIPVLAVVMLVIVSATVNGQFPANSLTAMFVGGGLCASTMLAIYWALLLDKSTRQSIVRRFNLNAAR